MSTWRRIVGEISGPPIRWAAWLLLCLIAAAGLGRLRVDNGLGGWAPQLEPLGPQQTYVYVGGPGDAAVATLKHLEALPQVGQVFDENVASQIGWLLGPDATRVVRRDDWHGAFLFAKDGVGDSELFDSVNQKAGDLLVAGPVAYRVAMNRQSQRRMPIIAGLVVLVGLLGVRLSGYDWRSAIKLTLVIGGAQAITFGLLGWLGRSIDVAATIAPPMMSALGFSLGLHRIGGASKPMLSACWVTTVLATLSFAVTGVPSVRQYALVAAGGLTVVFVATLWLIEPAERKARKRKPLGRILFQRSASRRVVIAATSVVILVLGVLAGRAVPLQSDGVRLLPADSQTRQAFEKLDANLTGLLPSQVTLEPAWPGFGEVARSTAGVRAVLDISALQQAAAGSRWWVLSSNDAGDRLAEAQGDWQRAASSHGSALSWRGVAAQLRATNRAIEHLALTALPTAGAIVFVALLVVTRSLRLATVGVVACALPLAILAIVLWLMSTGVAPATLMVGAIATGVAADDVLHIGRAMAKGPPEAASHLVRPCLASSFVSAGALVPLLLSPVPPTFQFGGLMAFAIVVAAGVVWVLMPTLGPAGSAPHDFAIYRQENCSIVASE